MMKIHYNIQSDVFEIILTFSFIDVWCFSTKNVQYSCSIPMALRRQTNVTKRLENERYSVCLRWTTLTEWQCLH